MRYRVTDYTIKGQTIVLPSDVTIEDIRLIVNETQKKVICSSMQKNNVYVNQTSEQSIVGVPSYICELQSGDQLTIEIDKGDSIANVARQGDDPNATLTAIYKLLKGSEPDTPEVIPEGVAERLALILEFFGIKPIQAYEFMTVEEVCSDLEEIMMSMDIDLTPEQAKEITNSTLNKG